MPMSYASCMRLRVEGAAGAAVGFSRSLDVRVGASVSLSHDLSCKWGCCSSLNIAREGGTNC